MKAIIVGKDHYLEADKPESRYVYLIKRGQKYLIMRTHGQFTGDFSQDLLTFSLAEAQRIIDNGGRPYGATMRGAFYPASRTLPRQ